MFAAKISISLQHAYINSVDLYVCRKTPTLGFTLMNLLHSEDSYYVILLGGSSNRYILYARRSCGCRPIPVVQRTVCTGISSLQVSTDATGLCGQESRVCTTGIFACLYFDFSEHVSELEMMAMAIHPHYFNVIMHYIVRRYKNYNSSDTNYK